MKQDDAKREALRNFVEKERKHLEEQAVESARLRKELAESEKQTQQPYSEEISRADKAQLEFMKQGRSTKVEQQKSREVGPKQEELGDQFEAAQLDFNLLNSRMNILRNSLDLRMNELAKLQVQAADSESKGDEKLKTALDAARKRYDEARKSYLEVKKLLNQEINSLSKLRQRPQETKPGDQSF
ncbi:hypothetical protein [Singulisphaera sp. GP187]|uniref:hypothetical protein n=1 Tax=Singulisphaera sp. GP187 TaxID=1882752 RepID=UPI0011610CB9|nr:hypothetical protein [Singulisphaera sp. GP187]